MRSYEHGGNPYAFETRTGIPLESAVDFSANINPIGPSERGLRAVVKALESQGGPLIRYPDPDYAQLRKRLAASHGGGVRETHVYPTNGGIEAIHDVFRALTPSRVMIVAPAFVEYEKAAKAHAHEIIHFVLDPANSFKLRPETFFREILSHRPDLVVLGSPNNPTGQIVETQTLKQALSLLADWGGALLTDEAFMEFLPEEETYSMAKDVPKSENLFVTRSLTKFYAVPGLRAGYLLTASPAFKAYWHEEKPVWGFNALAQVYVLEALDDKDYARKTRVTLQALKAKLVSSLSNFEEIQLYPGEANYVLIRVPDPCQATLKFDLESQGILIRDCSNYIGLEKGYFRLAVLAESEQSRLIQALSLICRSMIKDREAER